MKRIITLAVFLCFITPVMGASPAKEVENASWLFGGIHVDMNQSGATNSTFADLNPIAEDYTATWCDNCVPVEHALENVSTNDKKLNIYAFHRSIGEAEDPFGTNELDNRWEERYGERLPPTVVMHGKMMKLGSVAKTGSLESDYLEMTDSGPDLKQGLSTLVWDNVSNKATWSITYDESILEGGLLTSELWIVEESAYFADGSNGEENYPHIVRKIIELGEGKQGEVSVPELEAYDGDDLTIHLVHSIEPAIAEEEPEQEESEDDDGLPGFGIGLTLACLSLAAIARKQQ